MSFLSLNCQFILLVFCLIYVASEVILHNCVIYDYARKVCEGSHVCHINVEVHKNKLKAQLLKGNAYLFVYLFF